MMRVMQMKQMTEDDVVDVDDVCGVDEVDVGDVGDGQEVGDVVQRSESSIWQQFFGRNPQQELRVKTSKPGTMIDITHPRT